ncbi:amidohydrolase [Caloranaerobacter azorensis H53214]|uniref:Amidohydrolase n=1 Tax=Caloranaerobacter azorensis H53214 TaxID=1156417 RepID=A0A096CSQ8_9FIRM|nr:M20 family metallopeptidase [Caloranaerobacter azorensis]KGG79534.1 amidohydrolase [Caloranaerobacter azorensis H53214]
MADKLSIIGEEMKVIRRDLHKTPETGLNEHKTSKYIIEKLKKYGYTIERVAGTGVVAYKKGTALKKAIAFRADMDGLRVKEKTGVDYSSREDGMMHACGHDGHMAILLGLANYLSDFELNRDIVFLFQPAEEGPGGAEIIVREGVLKKYNVEYIFGLHILPDLEQGKIGVAPGPMMAQTGEFDIKITSKGGHGAMPHTAIDSIYIASQIINNYQSIISRNIEPIEGCVLTIGKIEGGRARNIIADNVRLEGTIRAFSTEVYNKIKERMAEINFGLEKMFNVNIDMEIEDMYPPVVNDYKLFEIFKDIFKDTVEIIKPMMISEDFSYYQREIPGLFFMLGSKNEKKGYIHPLHSCYFNFDEEILKIGLDAYLRICKYFGVISDY